MSGVGQVPAGPPPDTVVHTGWTEEADIVRGSDVVRWVGALLVVTVVTVAALGASGTLGRGSDRTRAGSDTVPVPADAHDASSDVSSDVSPPTPQQDDTPVTSDLDADAGAYAPASPSTTTAPRGAIDASLWPAHVEVPALSVSAPVQAVGVGEERELIIPSSPMDVGWSQGGPVPGEPGVALLTSHVDTREAGRGVLAGLPALETGDLILVTAADGTVQRWSVVERTQHRKDALPPELFARSGPARLALVTCGGPFDRDARSYRDNVVVWALALD